MEKFATVEVYREGSTKDKINLYITHDKSYGVKIEKGSEEISLPNMSDEKGILKNVLGEMLCENNDINQLSYLIEDYMFKQKSETA